MVSPLQIFQTHIEQAIRSFETNYMLLRGFLKDAAEKIRKMHLDMSEVGPEYLQVFVQYL